MASTTVSTKSESGVVSTTRTTTRQWHQSKVDISGRSHDTEEFLLGFKEAEWSKLLDDQDFLEPTTSTENN